MAVKPKKALHVPVVDAREVATRVLANLAEGACDENVRLHAATELLRHWEKKAGW